MKLLVTGGTVFVSRYTAEYFVRRGHEVYVLNRNTKAQAEGVHLIECDRHDLQDTLRGYHFDAVLDITSYTKEDVSGLLDALGGFDRYILVSSSAVYPETGAQPFSEGDPVGRNAYWGDYGTNKIEAEEHLLSRVPDAYILRPPYLYGEMNNLYREAFVFDCAEGDRSFYLPEDGSMPLQFFDIEDLCRFMEILLEKKPKEHIFNVGNCETVTVREWVTLCYQAVGKEPTFKSVYSDIPQRSYFPFLNYGYVLDTSRQEELLKDTKPLSEGLRQSYEWYKANRDSVRRKPLIEFIDENMD